MQRPDFAPGLRRVIAHGINAGKPRRLVDILIDRATDVRNALIKARNAGYDPIRIDIEGVKPTVELSPHPDFARLVEENVACYYITRCGRQGAERVGQFCIDGVRFVWTEGGH